MSAGTDWDTFARVLSARPDRLRLAGVQRTTGHDYRSARWPSADPGRPFAVYLAADGRYLTLALDLDTSGVAGDAQAAQLRQVLRQAGVAFVEAISGPAGHRHLLSTWPEGIPADEVAAVARALRGTVASGLDATPLLNPSTGCIRPPGARHRFGGRSEIVGGAEAALQILRKGNPQAALARLRKLTETGPSATRALGSDFVEALAAQELPLLDGEPRLMRRRRDLRPAQQYRLRHGDTDHEVTSRSATAASLAASMACAGWDFGEFLAAVRDQGNKGLEHLRTRRVGARLQPRHDVEQAARRMWRGRIRWLLNNPREYQNTAPPPVLDEIAAAAGAHPRRWGGQGGPSERAVLEFLLALARRCRTDEVGCDVRRLGLETGLSTSAAHRAIDRLRRTGWIQQVRRGRGRSAAIYQLQVPPVHRKDRYFTGPGGTLDPAPQAPPSDLAATPPAAAFELGLTARPDDAMTFAGLGRYAGLLLELLRSASCTAADLVERSGLAKRTVRAHLARLEAAGLASAAPDSLWHPHLWALDAAAEHFGAAGTVSSRREHVSQERAAWAWWLADQAAERGFATPRGLRNPGWSTTRTGVPCPRRPFPVSSDGRRSWAAGVDLVRAGMGPIPDELTALHNTPPPPRPRRREKRALAALTLVTSRHTPGQRVTSATTPASARFPLGSGTCRAEAPGPEPSAILRARPVDVERPLAHPD